ncbi:MAG TPA: hypothetical protein ENH55_05690 [Aurantimonas coralicida]|uniref:Uncharacterized protein n=2 Tax=root TaxID=1 RepID=A0A9C9NFW5_9HYPH|nr:hypothetical protein [Aurantimonas coralicida]HEU01265.1 hypothetical protein [Aurantimonas coralicida]
MPAAEWPRWTPSTSNKALWRKAPPFFRPTLGQMADMAKWPENIRHSPLIYMKVFIVLDDNINGANGGDRSGNEKAVMETFTAASIR